MSRPLASWSILGKRQKANDLDDDDFVDDSFAQDSDFADDGDLDDDDDVVFIKEEHKDEDIEDDGINFEADIDENIDLDAQYNERMEELPKLPAYHPDLPKITASLTGTIQEVLNIIEVNPCDSTHVQGIKTKGQGLLEIPKPKPVRIALLGDTGAGKSSLLNSIIDIPDLARALGSGESCTYVATEYETAFQQQQKRFAAEVQYFDMESIDTMLKEHVDSYVGFTFHPDSHWDQDIRMQYKRRSDTAIKTFCALFCQKQEFKSLPAGEKYLSMRKDNPGRVIEKMREWTRELLESVGKDDKGGIRGMYREADTKGEFRKEIDPLVTSSSNDGEPSLWPLVKFVRIGIKGSRILENITIADLPGISDTNQVKVNACLDRLRTCDGLWIVAPISRAVDSVTVDSLFARYEERFRDRIAIICTRTDDDVSRGLAAELEERGHSIAEYKKYAALARKFQGEISITRIKINRRMRAQATNMRTQKVRSLTTELRGWVAKKDKAEDKMWSAVVGARNKFVTKGLERAMQGHLLDNRKAKVFCVSNKHYFTLKSGDFPGLFQLSAEDTGVPALRSYALSLAAPGALQAVDDYIKHHYTVFLKGLNSWVVSRYVEGADGLLEIVQLPQAAMSKKLEHYCNELGESAKEHIEDKFKTRIARFSRDALTLFERKRGEKHWATIKAFMKKDGKYQTSACPKESWNEQFSDSVTRVIGRQWGKITSAQADLISIVESEVISEVQNMLDTLKAHDAVKSLDLDSFSAMMDGQIIGIENAFRDHQTDHIHEMGNIKLDATHDQHTGFFTKAMQRAYDRCKADYGNGTMERSNSYITAHLALSGDRSPFAITTDLLTKAISSNTLMQSNALEAELSRIMKDIYNHFDSMIDDEMHDAAQEALRSALKEYLEQALAKFDKLQDELQKMKQNYEKTEGTSESNGAKEVQEVEEAEGANGIQQEAEVQEIGKVKGTIKIEQED